MSRLSSQHSSENHSSSSSDDMLDDSTDDSKIDNPNDCTFHRSLSQMLPFHMTLRSRHSQALTDISLADAEPFLESC